MKNFLGGILVAYRQTYVQVLSVFVLIFSLLSLMYFTVNNLIALDDSFFHIRFAELLKQEGFSVFRDFPWIYFSKIAQDQSYFIYYNFLFYLFVMPFTFIKPLVLGLKLYATTLSALAFTGFFYILKRLNVSWALLWTLGLFSLLPNGLLQRTLMARPFVIAPLLLVFLLISLQSRHYWTSALLTTFYFFWHSATFFFPVGITIIYIAFRAFYRHRPDWKALATVFISTLATLGLSSFFAPGLINYASDIIFQAVYQVVIKSDIKLMVGNELFGVNLFDFIQTSILFAVLLVIAVVYEILRYYGWRRNSDIPATEQEVLGTSLFFISLGFVVAVYLSGRNSDFLVWFGLVFGVISITSLARNLSIRDKISRRALAGGLIIACLYFSTSQLLSIRNLIAQIEPYDSIQPSAEWLRDHTREGDVVFLSNWSHFARAFYYNTSNNYTMGIEPRFIYDYNPRLYWLWAHIVSSGYVCPQVSCEQIKSAQTLALRRGSLTQEWVKEQGKQMAEVIEQEFHSQYILTQQDHRLFNQILETSGKFERVQTSNSFAVYRILE